MRMLDERTCLLRPLGLLVCALASAATCRAMELDCIVFGDEASEAAHAFLDGGTSIVETGESGATCRRIKKPQKDRWRAGPMRFKLKVSPTEKTYFTCRLWGGDTSHDHLFVTLDGKMFGQMHLGEYDLLDYESCWPRDADRATSDAEHFGVFTYRTFLVPESATKGKDEIEVAVYAAGHVWGYGANFEQFQKMVLHDSRGIYAFFTHTKPLERFLLAARNLKMAKNVGPYEKEPDVEGLKAKVNKHLTWLIESGVVARGERMDDVGLLAEAYNTKWTVAYRNDEAVKAIVAAVDAEARKERDAPGSVITEGTWHGAGRSAIGVARLGTAAVAPYMDDARRSLWREFFLKSVEYMTTHRRYFANQSQILDTNAHWCNRALKIVDEKAGPPLAVTLEHVKEAMGLKPMPNGYVALTAKGLSKEDGYVGSYGESTIWAAANACEASDGDEELLRQLVKASEARLYMRYPGVRRDGRRVARLEAQVSWRNEHFPGPPTYLTNNLDIHNAVLARSPALVGAVRDMYEDGVLAEYAATAKGNDINSLRFPDDWRKVRMAIDRFGERLPHLPCFGEDFVWCDPEDGVVVVRNGVEMLFVEAYWRARGGINNLAKIHLVLPLAETVATVECEETFTQKDNKAERIGDWFQYGWMDRLYREGYGDEDGWPLGNVTAGASRPKAENDGRAEFYVVRYGPYVVAVNDSIHGKSYELEAPNGAWRVLPSGDKIRAGKLTIPPKSCVVLRRL